METVLLIDGEVLKNQILEAKEPYTPQTICQFVYKAVSEIKKSDPKLKVKVNYYGARPLYDAVFPISKRKFNEEDMKQTLHKAKIPNAVEFNTFWGRSQKMDYGAWIMKPESFEKDPKTLTDDDFVLQVPKKGVTSKLVDAMAETAIRHKVEKVFVLGNPQDLRYAADVTNAFGLDVDWIRFYGKRPELDASLTSQEPVMSSISNIKEDQEKLGVYLEEYMPKLLKDLRKKNPIKRNILMLDMGCITAYLHSNKLEINGKNISQLIDQISKRLGVGNLEKICYATKKLHSKIRNPKKSLKDNIRADVPDEIDGAIVSQGIIQQREPYYSILKETKWMTPHNKRTASDFEANIQQYDVDDRIVYDMTLARFDSSIDTIYLLTKDTDFMASLQKAKEAGLSVCIVNIHDTPLPKQLAEHALGVYSPFIETSNLESHKHNIQTKSRKKKQQASQPHEAKKSYLTYEMPDLTEEEQEIVHWHKKPTKEERLANQRHRKQIKRTLRNNSVEY